MNAVDEIFDVALSYAGEDRSYARVLAQLIKASGFSVFFDEYEKATLWGRNLYTYLSDVYQHRARFCVIFISSNYARKLWTKRELESAQARAFRESREYILPLPLDDTALPGIEDTVAYIDLGTTPAKEVCQLIVQKIGMLAPPAYTAGEAAAKPRPDDEQIQKPTSRDLLLRLATEVIDELNKMAVDINSMLDDDVPEDVWRAFYKGDRSIFARRLARNKDVYTVPALEKLFATDNRFRDLVIRYMRTFDTLLIQSGKADPEDVLRATFLTADVGKLYLITTRTLGSVEKLA